ncbi:hypothetical protein [Paraflavitalea speifideaquila]|uniref:hypothetical protein n=1 Tax=Paraflavitalea speifideaquila TaxID=3076558 RepID=UPI0028E25A54|nr:hypothetical protein [Paraflavitalea speifideiaquila]
MSDKNHERLLAFGDRLRNKRLEADKLYQKVFGPFDSASRKYGRVWNPGNNWFQCGILKPADSDDAGRLIQSLDMKSITENKLPFFVSSVPFIMASFQRQIVIQEFFFHISDKPVFINLVDLCHFLRIIVYLGLTKRSIPPKEENYMARPGGLYNFYGSKFFGYL